MLMFQGVRYGLLILECVCYFRVYFRECAISGYVLGSVLCQGKF